jgi:hypothetical protein
VLARDADVSEGVSTKAMVAGTEAWIYYVVVRSTKETGSKIASCVPVSQLFATVLQ